MAISVVTVNGKKIKNPIAQALIILCVIPVIGVVFFFVGGILLLVLALLVILAPLILVLGGIAYVASKKR